MAIKYLRPESRAFTLLLGLIASTQALATSITLPALPLIADTLHAPIHPSEYLNHMATVACCRVSRRQAGDHYRARRLDRLRRRPAGSAHVDGGVTGPASTVGPCGVRRSHHYGGRFLCTTGGVTHSGTLFLVCA